MQQIKLQHPMDSMENVDRRDHYKEHQKILIAVDCIVFGFDGTELNALLVKRKFEPKRGQWSLAGGFIRNDEDARSAANRVLYELTGLKDLYIEQFHTFTEVERETEERVVSIAYFSLIKINKDVNSSPYSFESKWFPLSELPPLIFDHEKIIEAGKEALRGAAAIHPVGLQLLPPKFTIPQLRTLYEAIYEMEMDKRNFSKKIRSLNILTRLNEKEKSSSKKGAYYYKFKKEKYERLSVGLKAR